MTEPYWFSREEALGLHDLMLADYGGHTGVRDETMLASALAKPRQLFACGQPTPAEMAAAYAAGVIKTHLFLDGNKRTGFILAAAFLEINGYTFFASEVEAALQTLALAAGEITQNDYAMWLAKNSRPA